MNFVTTRHGYRYSTSVGGTLTGRGGNILIIDDPLKSDDAFSEAKRSAVNEWFDGTLYSRLDDKREGVIILIMQRLHLEDLAGHVLRREPWVHLNLPAIAEIDEQIPIWPNKIYLRTSVICLHPEREPNEVAGPSQERAWQLQLLRAVSAAPGAARGRDHQVALVSDL